MGRGVNVKAQKEEKGNVAGKIPLVEIYRLHVDENIKYLRRTQTDTDSVAKQRLIFGKEEAAQVFKAITVTEQNTLYIQRLVYMLFFTTLYGSSMCPYSLFEAQTVSDPSLFPYNMCRFL